MCFLIEHLNLNHLKWLFQADCFYREPGMKPHNSKVTTTRFHFFVGKETKKGEQPTLQPLAKKLNHEDITIANWLI